EVTIGLGVVGVGGDVVDIVVRLLEYDAFPLSEGGHARMRRAADDELELGIEHAHGLRRAARQPAVLACAAGADLPGAVHLVAETPARDAVRLFRPVRPARVR